MTDTADAQPRIVIDTAPRTREPQPVYAHPPTPARRRRGWIVAGGVGAVVVLASGTFGLLQLRDAERTGASTPEEAIDALVTAIEAEDALGALATILPSERAAWGEPLVEMVAQAQRLDVLADDIDLGALPGSDLTTDLRTGRGVDLAPGIVAVPVTGTVGAIVDWSAMPLGSLVLGRSGVPADVRGVARLSLPVVAVEDGGTWYVSPLHTAAELLRRRLGGGREWPAERDGLLPVGAATPEDAVVGFVGALASLNVAETLARLDPSEAGVVQRIAPWFIDPLQSVVDTATVRADMEVLAVDVTPRVVSADADQAVVALDGVAFDVSVEGALLRFSTGCVSVRPLGGDPVEMCASTPEHALGVADGLASLGLEPVAETLGQFIADLRAAFDGAGGADLVVNRVDDAWYVSPVGSLWHRLFSLAGALEPSELVTLLGDLDGVREAYDAWRAPVVEAQDEPAAEQVDPLVAYHHCQAAGGYDEVVACVEDGLRSGAFSRDVVDGVFLVPECGWVGARFDESLKTLPDAEYVARATLAAACVDERIAAGVITESQRPFELYRVHCLAGKNPFNMTVTESRAYSNCRLEEVLAPPAEG